MWFRSLSTFFLTSQLDRFRRPSRSARRLFVEGLENRNLLTAYMITDLGSLGGGYTYAADLNEAGQVVGYSDTGTGDSRAFLWNSGTMIDLGTLGGNSSYATAVNDLGQVVGYSYLAGDQLQHAFLLTPQGGKWFQDSDSDGRNDFMTDLGTAADLTSFKALHSNDSGQVAGYDMFEDPVYGWANHAVVWEVDGSVTDLGLMPGGYDSFGEDINNAGQVVGYGWKDVYSGWGDVFSETRPFLWDATNGMVQLPEISSGFELYPYWNEEARSINDAGTVLVTCYGASYSAVQDRAFLLTPVPEGTPSISIADANTVIEGDTGTRPASFSVMLSAASSQTVSVSYTTSNYTATAGSDYQSTSGTLTFAPGETSKTIAVQVIGDRVAEPNENFFVNLSSPTNAYIAEGRGLGTIVDDESKISINDVALKEGAANKTTAFTFTITLSASTGYVTVYYATASGTATGGTDYASKSGMVTFRPGETSKQITISVKGDKTKEANETFFVNLSNASGGVIADGQGLGTILDDDSGGVGGKQTTSASAFDAAISDWLSPSDKKRKS